MLAMTAIFCSTFMGAVPLATQFTVYTAVATSATLHSTSDADELLHHVVVQTSVNTTARLLMLKTMT